MNGEQLGYFNNSLVLNSKENFKHNNLHGIQEYFSISGHLAQKTYFENGVEIGPSICFFKSGKVETKEEFKVDTNESSYVIYYENGIKRVEGQYQNKQPFGEWIFWDEKGIEVKKVNINSEKEKMKIIIFLYDLKANK